MKQTGSLGFTRSGVFVEESIHVDGDSQSSQLSHCIMDVAYQARFLNDSTRLWTYLNRSPYDRMRAISCGLSLTTHFRPHFDLGSRSHGILGTCKKSRTISGMLRGLKPLSIVGPLTQHVKDTCPVCDTSLWSQNWQLCVIIILTSAPIIV